MMKQQYSLINRLNDRQIGLIRNPSSSSTTSTTKTIINYNDNHKQSSKILSNMIIDENIEYTNKFYYKDLLGHYGCVNTVEFSNDGNLMISGGDDKRVLIWRLWDAIVDKNYKPRIMCKEHSSNIFCLSFDNEQKRIYSGGNDDLVIVHNIETGDAIDVFAHMNDVYCISVNPINNNIFASASNEIRIWDLRSSLSCQHLQSNGVFHGVQYNPTQPFMIATASSQFGIELYDLRQPLQRLSRFFPSYMVNSPAAMCVHFNHNGDKILALGRKLPPVLYDVRCPYPQLLFEGDGFYNYCTLKDCSFAGQNDQYVISGSDNFYIYMWKIPDIVRNDKWKQNPLNNDSTTFVAKPIQILTGHRSIVNKVRFNKQNGIIASTGVEKMIRLWSPLIRFDEDENYIDSKEPKFSRQLYHYTDYIGDLDLHNSSEHIFEEDYRLIAYFDIMLKRDISLSSYSSSDDENRSYFELCDYSSSSSADNEQQDNDGNGDNNNYPFIDLKSDTDDKFHIQNHYNFKNNQTLFNNNAIIIENNRKNLNNDNDNDYMNISYSKRMYIRYLKSIVNIIIKQLETIQPELNEILQQSLQSSSTTTTTNVRKSETTLKHEQRQENVSILFLMRKLDNEFRSYNDLYKCIQIKKKYKLLLQSFRFVSELYGALRTGTLFRRSYNNHGELNLKTIINLLMKSDQVDILARKMSIIEERKLCDRKLHGLIISFYKKILQLAKLLLDVKCFINLRNNPIEFCHLSCSNNDNHHQHSIFCLNKRTSTRCLTRNYAEVEIDTSDSSSDDDDIIDWNTDNNNSDINDDDGDVIGDFPEPPNEDLQSSSDLSDDDDDDNDDDDDERKKKNIWSNNFLTYYSDSSDDDSSDDIENDDDDDDNVDIKEEPENKSKSDNIEPNDNDNGDNSVNNNHCSSSTTTTTTTTSSSTPSSKTKSVHFKKIDNYRQRNYKKQQQQQRLKQRQRKPSSSSSSSSSLSSSPMNKKSKKVRRN